MGGGGVTPTLVTLTTDVNTKCHRDQKGTKARVGLGGGGERGGEAEWFPPPFFPPPLPPPCPTSTSSPSLRLFVHVK